MLNSNEDEDEQEMRGMARMGLRIKEGLERIENE